MLNAFARIALLLRNKRFGIGTFWNGLGWMRESECVPNVYQSMVILDIWHWKAFPLRLSKAYCCFLLAVLLAPEPCSSTGGYMTYFLLFGYAKNHIANLHQFALTGADERKTQADPVARQAEGRRGVRQAESQRCAWSCGGGRRPMGNCTAIQTSRLKLSIRVMSMGHFLPLTLVDAVCSLACGYLQCCVHMDVEVQWH